MDRPWDRLEDFQTLPPPQHESRSGSIILFLSLFLLVLAFFIMLVSISTVEAVKSKAVMKSLNSTFTTILPPRVEKPTDFTAKEGDILAAQEFQEKITGLFATSFQVAKVETVKPGRLIRVEIPQNSVFFATEARIRPDALALLDRIVASLSSRPPGMRFDMEFVIGTGNAGDKILPVLQTLEMARAGAIAREVISRGAPLDSVSVGLAPGNADQITIRFYIRYGDEARLRFPGPRENKPQ